MCRKHEKTGQSNIDVVSCFFRKTIYGNSVSLSSLKTALPKNGNKTRPLVSAKYSQKELFHAVESEVAGSSDNVGSILISNGLTYPEGVKSKER